jgi:hypothetical protein
MTFVFPFLLGGLVLVSIPVLIHLIMRQKPKSLAFPAFRFLVQRHRTNQRKLRLRQLLLLGLRMLLIAAACLALARPKVFNEALKLGSDRPVAAVLIFDTRPSMEYTVSTPGGKLTRLDDAKRRGHELLNQLPAGSKVLILDPADPPLSGGKGEWLLSMHQARKRIDGLQIRYGGGPVNGPIEDAYRLFEGLARARGDESSRRMARLLAVFSDRTRASWDASRLQALHDAQDRVPPPFERLSSIRDRVPGVVELLGELPSRLPGGQDLPGKDSLIEALEKARERASELTEDEYPDRDLGRFLSTARVRTRELLRGLDKLSEDLPAAAKEYRTKLIGVLRELLHETRGVHEVYIDVGVDNPADGALLDFELPRDPRQNAPRQVFAADDKVQVRAVVQASGKDLVNLLRWTVDNRKEPDTPIRVKAGERATFGYEIDCSKLKPGEHQLQAELVNPDLLPGNNVRYLTFAVRQPRHILVIADDTAAAQRWKDALESLRSLAEFRVTLATPAKILHQRKDNPAVLNGYQAVYLFDVKAPDAELWTVLAGYVAEGGGVGIVPGREMVLDAYRTREARQVMPGELQRIESSDGKGQWSWDSMDFQHPLMAPFKAWKGDRGTDFVSKPRTASRYWKVKPGKEGTTLVRYASGAPALVARALGGKDERPGKVLLFTTILDDRKPAWNDYPSSLSSFYVVLAFQSTSYLAGDAEPVQLNFLLGQTAPVVALPLAQRSRGTYNLLRNGVQSAEVPAESGHNVLRLPQAQKPGNYTVTAEGKQVAALSVNLPQEEVLLDRLPITEVEALFGHGSVVPVDVRADLSAAMSGQWSQPVELFPFLMVLILFVLAVENLLANKFYRREPEAQG